MEIGLAHNLKVAHIAGAEYPKKEKKKTMVLRHDNHPFMKFIPIIMTLLVRRWHSVQRLGKDISFHIKGLFQKNLEWYHFNLCIWIFLISCMHFSCSLSPLSLFHKFKCFLWSCWLLRLLVIKVKVGLLILGFAILDGLMVNLSFLMERSAFHHLSCLTVFSIHYVFLEHVLYFFFFFLSQMRTDCVMYLQWNFAVH